MLTILLVCDVVAPLAPGPALLLVTGALIGIPHGASDFVVGHRLLAFRLGFWWLPTFLAVYVLVAALVLSGWWIAPGPTFAAFLGISALHFGAGAWNRRQGMLSTMRMLARALTPLLPIFLLHPGAVADIVGLLLGCPAADVAAHLEDMRTTLLPPYVGLLALVVAAPLTWANRTDRAQAQEATELVLLALAAWLLPPFLTFAIYFCGMHAVRHMAELGSDHHPTDMRAALRLAMVIVVPSAILCCVALAVVWEALDGVLPSEAVLGDALRLVAALTLPHVLLEWWADTPKPCAKLFSSADRIPPVRIRASPRRTRR